MRIRRADAHIHLFRNGYNKATRKNMKDRCSEVQTYEQFLNTHNISAALVIGYEAENIDPTNNNYIRELAIDRPWIHSLAFHPAAFPPTLPWLAERFDEGHLGLALYVLDQDAAKKIAEWPKDIWNKLDRRGAIVSINAKSVAMPLLRSVLDTAQNVTFLFSHLGLPGKHSIAPPTKIVEEKLANLLALAQGSNAWVKISGLYAVSEPHNAWPQPAANPFIEVVLKGFGNQRCVWGSDFSPALEFISFEQTIDFHVPPSLDDGAVRNIMGENLFGLLSRAKHF